MAVKFKLKKTVCYMVILWALIISATTCQAKELLQQQGDFIYYVGDGSRIRLCGSSDRALERGWNIEKVESGMKKVEFTSSEMGNFIYNYFLISGGGLVFAFDRDSQKEFLKTCAMRFHRMITKRNPKVKYTVDNYLRVAGVYKLQDPYVIKFCANYYRESFKKSEYIYLITIETYNFRTGKKVKEKFLAGKTADTGIDFVKNEIVKGE